MGFFSNLFRKESCAELSLLKTPQEATPPPTPVVEEAPTETAPMPDSMPEEGASEKGVSEEGVSEEVEKSEQPM